MSDEQTIQQRIDDAVKADRKRLADDIQRRITQWINTYGHPVKDYDAGRIDAWRDVRVCLMEEGR